MIGGLFKSASRLALVAAAGVLVGGVSARAADLGGDCCADLEERVAELEATTVRKGNRRVSLQLSGQVHESIMYWDDGVEQNVYTGVNHINSSSRFRFVGSARINPTWQAGYLMEIEVRRISDSSTMTQVDHLAPARDANVVVRHNAWWIDNRDLGRVWLGQTDPAGAGIDGINLSNSNIAANSKIGLTNAGFRLRGNAHATDGTVGNLSNLTWGGILGGNNGLVNLGDETRQNVIKYVSPTLMGFIFSASWGEDDFWDVALRYAGEFGGFKIALGATYAQTTDANPGGAEPNVPADPAGRNFAGCADLANQRFTVVSSVDRDCSSWTVAGSLMHVATGLFVAGSYGQREDSLRRLLVESIIDNANAVNFDSTDTFWQVRGGIEQNFFGIGRTTLFGEYNRFEGTPLAAGNTLNLSQANGRLLGFAGPANAAGISVLVARSEVTAWGLGIVQTIDAAAMDLYLTYRNYSADLVGVSRATGDRIDGTGVKDFSVVTFGGRIQF